jgi:hypothetical protein
MGFWFLASTHVGKEALNAYLTAHGRFGRYLDAVLFTMQYGDDSYEEGKDSCVIVP